MIMFGLIFLLKKGENKMPIAKTKRDLIDILTGVPKDAYEKGPRPSLHHPDVLKA